jgi:hypothetical protein
MKIRLENGTPIPPDAIEVVSLHDGNSAGITQRRKIQAIAANAFTDSIEACLPGADIIDLAAERIKRR